MANVLVYIELKNNEARATSLCALNVGRTIATSLGATLYALLPCSVPPSYANDDIIAVLSRHGADKVILTTGPDLGDIALHATHGEAVRLACMQFRPRLVLFAATAGGRDLAPRLGMQLGARYLADVELESGEDNFELAAVSFRRQVREREPLCRTVPTVATLRCHATPRAVGDDEAEVVMLQSPRLDPSGPRVESRRAVAPGDLPSARLVLAGGSELGQAEAFHRLEKLASALGAGTLMSAGTVAQMAQRLRSAINAELCIAFGMSGSDQDIACLPRWMHLIAVNADSTAPILQVADEALAADADQTLRELLAALEQPPEGE